MTSSVAFNLDQSILKMKKNQFSVNPADIAKDIEDNQLVIFYMKNISRGCVVRR